MTTWRCCPLCDKDVQSLTALTGHLEFGHDADPAAVLGIRQRRNLRGSAHRLVRRYARPARHVVAVALMVGAVFAGAWVDDNVHGGDGQHATHSAP